MPIESWTIPDETPDLAARATAMIDAALVGTGLAPDRYWAAVRKGYNTPYNDPQRDGPTLPETAPPPVAVCDVAAHPVAADPIAADTIATPLPVAAMAAVLAAEIRPTP